MFANMDINSLILLGIALFNALAAFLAYKTKIIADQTHVIATQSAADIHKVELATNSMKDALVAATAKENFQAGKEAGTRREEERAVTLAQGRLEGSVLPGAAQGLSAPRPVSVGVQKIVAGEGVDVDASNPKAPEVSVKPEVLKLAVDKAVDKAVEEKK